MNHPSKILALAILTLLTLSPAALALEIPGANDAIAGALAGAGAKIAEGVGTADTAKANPPPEGSTVETTESGDGTSRSTRTTSFSTQSTSEGGPTAHTTTVSTTSEESGDALGAIAGGFEGFGDAFDGVSGNPGEIADIGLLHEAAAMADQADASGDAAGSDETEAPAEPPALNDESQSGEEDLGVCSMEAKACPDGSFVARLPPTCAFAACPTSDGTVEGSTPTDVIGAIETVDPSQPALLDQVGDLLDQADAAQDTPAVSTPPTDSDQSSGEGGAAEEAPADELTTTTTPADTSALDAGLSATDFSAGHSSNAGAVDASELIDAKERIRLTLDIDRSLFAKKDGSMRWDNEDGWVALGSLFAGLSARGPAATAAATAAPATEQATDEAPAQAPPTAGSQDAGADEADDSRPRARVAARSGGGGSAASKLAQARKNEGDLLVRWIHGNVDTYVFDGRGLDLYKFEKLVDPACKACRRYVFVFYSDHPGYGDRAGLDLEIKKTPHFLTLIVDGTEVVKATVDDKYDELHNQLIGEEAAGAAGAAAEEGEQMAGAIAAELPDEIFGRIFELRFNLPSDAIIEMLQAARDAAASAL